MIKIKEAIIVEGKYDRIRLASIFDTAVIETGGFRVFKDEEKAAIIRELAHTRGIVLLTDSDGAGFVIRNHIKSIIKDEDANNIKQAYIPEIQGKEKRKAHPSKQGLLGVEGMTDEIIVSAVKKSGVTFPKSESQNFVENPITKADFYEWGLSGSENSSTLRKQVLQTLGFPQYMTTNSLLSAVKLLYTKNDFQHLVRGCRP